MKFVIVDSQPPYVQSLGRAIVGAGHSLAGEAYCMTDAESCIHSVRPDFVFIDIAIEGGSGFRLIEQCKDQLPCRFVIVTEHHEEYTVFRILQQKVFGYIHKGPGFTRATEACFRELGSGRPYFDELFKTTRYQSLTNPSSLLKILSDRELSVLQYIGLGCSDAQIADQLSITRRTAQHHRLALFRKLDIQTNQHLAFIARDFGISLPFHADVGERTFTGTQASSRRPAPDARVTVSRQPRQNVHLST